MINYEKVVLKRLIIPKYKNKITVIYISTLLLSNYIDYIVCLQCHLINYEKVVLKIDNS